MHEVMSNWMKPSERERERASREIVNTQTTYMYFVQSRSRQFKEDRWLEALTVQEEIRERMPPNLFLPLTTCRGCLWMPLRKTNENMHRKKNTNCHNSWDFCTIKKTNAEFNKWKRQFPRLKLNNNRWKTFFFLHLLFHESFYTTREPNERKIK